MRTPSFRLLAAAFMIAAGLSGPGRADSGSLVTPWQSGDNTRARLIAGGRLAAGDTSAVAVGLEITLAPAWKTYWRNPGSSGVPPRIEWKGSRNVAALEVRFPAPQRLKEVDGDVIGYLNHVVLPLIVRPADPGQPVLLDLVVEYGVCKDLCIPVEMKLQIDLPPDAGLRPMPEAIATALSRVPRDAAARRSGDPVLKAVHADLASPKPVLRLEIETAESPGEADLFLEAPDGLWIPMTQKSEVSGRVARFVVDLSDGADLAALRERTIRATMVAPGGAAEATFTLK